MKKIMVFALIVSMLGLASVYMACSSYVALCDDGETRCNMEDDSIYVCENNRWRFHYSCKSVDASCKEKGDRAYCDTDDEIIIK